MKVFLTGVKKLGLLFILAGALLVLPVRDLDPSPAQANAAALPGAAVDNTPLYLPLIIHQPAPQPLINVPYLGSGPTANAFEPAIFWFGQVTSSLNSADVRLWYYDESLKIVVHIIDRRLWSDKTPSAASLEAWDAVTLLLDQAGSADKAPAASAYRLVAQLGSSTAHQAAYRGSGAGWTAIPLPYEAQATWRGGGPNSGDDAKGWQLTYVIPFSSLGLSQRPAAGTSGAWPCRCTTVMRLTAIRPSPTRCGRQAARQCAGDLGRDEFWRARLRPAGGRSAGYNDHSAGREWRERR